MFAFDSDIISFSFIKRLASATPWIIITGFLLIFFILKALVSTPSQSILSRVLKSETDKTSIMQDSEKEAMLANYIQSGKQLFRAEQYTNARYYFGKALEIDPDNKMGEVYLSKIQKRLDEMKHSRDEHVQFEAAKEKRISRLLLWVDELYSKGAFKTAKMLIDAKVDSDERIDSRSDKIEIAFKIKEKEDLKELKKKGELEAAIIQWFKIAKRRYKTGRYSDSLYYLNKIVATKKSAREVRKAKRLIPELRKIVSDQIKLKLYKANEAFLKKDFKGALTQYKEVLEVSPRNKIAIKKVRYLKDILLKMVKSHYEKGEIYEGLGMFVKAQQEYQNAINVAPNRSNFYYKKALKKKRVDWTTKNVKK